MKKLLVIVLLLGFSYVFKDDVQSLWSGIYDKKVYIAVPTIAQKPELPRGCEVTALAMMLQHAGRDVSKLELAKQLTKVPFENGGLKGNPNDGFVGDMYSFNQPGLGVYNRPIEQLANQYLPNRIINLSGKGFDEVITHLDEKKPVWVIQNAKYDVLSEGEWQSWETSEGPINVTYQEHSVLVIGYDKNQVYFNDPLTGQTEKAPKEGFIAGWEQMGSQAITYR
ncbi:C39 family peptidase [Neobacillus sp. PS2-9]|uniref:C39 family peptidase n=1 Tax=Neobacillus sp. PS2-9 TaxID=3070676 RepID=UPI0027DFD4BD|nr:C39 family peptidase [Neobacillus sp. PS2-9]WML58713.1 C39 family peptidase [Neobacillus sp. PS2-9]